VIKNYSKSDPVVVATLGKGDFFGEMSLFLQEPRSASVVTAEDTIVLEISQSNYCEMIQSNPGMLFNMIKTLCSRINSLNSRVRTTVKTNI
jgi:CRP-like cAMP-binding protein